MKSTSSDPIIEPGQVWVHKGGDHSIRILSVEKRTVHFEWIPPPGRNKIQVWQLPYHYELSK